MNLHTTGKNPDWHNTKHLTRWQAVAIATNGIVTPGNIISVLGFITVCIGSILLYHGFTLSGILLVIGGRLLDLIDGVVAEATKTKSQLGELVDTTCDKLSILVIVVAAYTYGVMPVGLIIILIVHNLYTALFSVLYARRYQIHTSRTGKYAMFISWVTIIVTIISNLVDNRIIDIGALLALVTYAVLAMVACFDYYLILQRKIIERLRGAQWTKKVDQIVYVHNNKATHSKRAQKWMDRIAGQLNKQTIDIQISDAPEKLLPTLRAAVDANKTVLLAIAGGDGTISSIANIVLKAGDERLLKSCYVLPLWGGNANDFAYMLNGLVSNSTPRRLLAQSSVVPVPTIDIILTTAQTTQQIYACCYASFGASAYAAKQLDKKRIASRRFWGFFPPLVIAREMLSVAKAFKDSPMFRAEIDNVDRDLYEHTFINGSRIGKVNRVPMRLDEPAFFHAAIDRKHPSLIIELIRIVTKKTKKEYTKKQTVTFIVKDPISAQIDGEVYPIAPGTHIQVDVNAQSLQCVSTQL